MLPMAARKQCFRQSDLGLDSPEACHSMSAGESAGWRVHLGGLMWAAGAAPLAEAPQTCLGTPAVPPGPTRGRMWGLMKGFLQFMTCRCQYAYAHLCEGIRRLIKSIAHHLAGIQGYSCHGSNAHT